MQLDVSVYAQHKGVSIHDEGLEEREGSFITSIFRDDSNKSFHFILFLPNKSSGTLVYGIWDYSDE